MVSRLKATLNECVSAVGSIKTFSIKVYYHLTAYVPRKLPTDQAEIVAFKETLQLYFGLDDRHDVWLTVYGQITSTPATKLRKSYGEIANAARRHSVINPLAQNQKIATIKALEGMLKEKLEEQTEHEIRQKATAQEIAVAPV